MLPAVVLMGHDIRPAGQPVPETPYDTVIDAGTLETTLRELAEQGYRFVSFDDFMLWRHRGGVALLTFDDAYVNVVDVALPVLEKLGVPALVFAIASGLECGDPFPHFLHELQERWPRGSVICRHPSIAKVVASTPYGSLDELFQRSPGATHDAFAKVLRPDELRALSADLVASGTQPRRTMDRAQIVRSLRSGLLDYGAHSMTHRALSTLPHDDAEAEIRDSTAALAELTGRPPVQIAFAYPYGFVSAHAAAAVARLCRAGFTCAARPVSAIDRDATLPRFNLDRLTPQRTRDAGSLGSAVASLRETALLYARTERGRRLAAPLRRALRALTDR
jgi:peptidoglycan/xylan/chitin deacetylase (PgdA/CDA1 family)